MDTTPDQNNISEPTPNKEVGTPGSFHLNQSVTPETVKEPTTPKISPIRTYQSDAARSVKENQTSLTRMVIAEQGRKDRLSAELSPRSSKNIVLISLSVILLITGVLLATYFFVKTITPKVGTENGPERIPALILTEQDFGVDITGNNRETIWKKSSGAVKELTPRLDSLVNIYFTETKDYMSQPEIINTEKFFSAIESRIPGTLLRSLDSSFLFGIHSFNGNQPFLILKTNFYENAAAGMYSWESGLAGEILPLFGIAPQNNSEIYRRAFVDSVIKNKDVRVLRDDTGQPLLIYYFKDKKTIIITTNEATLSEIITRLSTAKSPVR